VSHAGQTTQSDAGDALLHELNARDRAARYAQGLSEDGESSVLPPSLEEYAQAANRFPKHAGLQAANASALWRRRGPGLDVVRAFLSCLEADPGYAFCRKGYSDVVADYEAPLCHQKADNAPWTLSIGDAGVVLTSMELAQVIPFSRQHEVELDFTADAAARLSEATGQNVQEPQIWRDGEGNVIERSVVEEKSAHLRYAADSPVARGLIARCNAKGRHVPPELRRSEFLDR